MHYEVRCKSAYDNCFSGLVSKISGRWTIQAHIVERFEKAKPFITLIGKSTRVLPLVYFAKVWQAYTVG